MIIQITLLRNELHFLKELFPVWEKYVDGFVFLDDSSDDGSYEYLIENKEKYNILDVIRINRNESQLTIETDIRQLLFDTANKYSPNIICLDADEYLDGSLSKKDLENLLENNGDATYFLDWIQYTSENTIRVDGPWAENIKDRIGRYVSGRKFEKAQTHSTHLPINNKTFKIPRDKLFISHLQWLDKNFVGIKQYFWKITDYVTKNKFNQSIVDSSAYDSSVANFDWQEEYFEYPLKIRSDIFEDISNSSNYRIKYINEKTKEYSIPNLGDWGLNIANSIPMYFCTHANSNNYKNLLNLINCIHNFHFYDLESIDVYDVGLTNHQINELNNIKKINIIKQNDSSKIKIISKSLEKYPYIIYFDAEIHINRPINNLFNELLLNRVLMNKKDNGFLGISISNLNAISDSTDSYDDDFSNRLSNKNLDIKYFDEQSLFERVCESLNKNSFVDFTSKIKYKYEISIITAIGDIQKYQKFINRYFDNIQEQITFSKTEHIIVYSEWSSIFDQYINFKNIKFIKEDKKLGVYNAWNIGINNSTGKYISNWNVDDLRHPLNNKIKYDALNKNNHVGVVYNYYISTNVEETFHNIDLKNKTYLKFPDNYHKYVMNACLAGPDPMWRKSIHYCVGLFNYNEFPSIGDWDMWIKMSKANIIFKLIPEFLCIYTQHPNTVSNTTPNVEKEKQKLYNLHSDYKSEWCNIIFEKVII